MDDLVVRANSAFVDDQFDEALRLYTEALKVGAATGQLFSKRAATHLKLGRPAEALEDALQGLNLNPEDAMLHYRKGLAFFQMKQFSDAEQAFVQAKNLGASDLDKWIEKCHLETEGQEPAAAATSSNPATELAERTEIMPSQTTLASKIRDSFYDNRSYLSYTIYAKNLKPDDVKVEFVNDKTVNIKLVLPDHSVWQKQVRLFSYIIPSESRFELNPFKLALTLQKKHPGEKWDRLDEAQPVNVENIIEQYPTSSKKKQNWNSIEKQVKEEEEKEQPDGDQALNKLFQQIYANASEDTKKAMIKSYQTSGGTVLSTNWDEVKDKNYEETVEAPAGMEVHRWNSLDMESFRIAVAWFAIGVLTKECHAERAFTIINLLIDDVAIFHLNPLGYEIFVDEIETDQVLEYAYSTADITLRFRSKLTSAWLFDELVDAEHSHQIHIAALQHLDELRRYARDNRKLWLNNVGSEPLKYFVFPENDGFGYNGSLDVVTDRVWFEQDNIDNISLAVTWISNSPRIAQVERLLSDWECELLIQMAKSNELQSSLVDINYGKVAKVSTRTSSQIWIKLDHSLAVRRISERIAALMRLDRNSIMNVSESIQLLHYGQGVGYVTGHYDWFWPRKALIDNRANRYATVFIYLNDVEQGGYTTFFDKNISRFDTDQQCQSARIRIKPKRGRAVIFYNMLEDGNLDEEAMHAGCVPISGDKYAANFC